MYAISTRTQPMAVSSDILFSFKESRLNQNYQNSNESLNLSAKISAPCIWMHLNLDYDIKKLTGRIAQPRLRSWYTHPRNRVRIKSIRLHKILDHSAKFLAPSNPDYVIKNRRQNWPTDKFYVEFLFWNKTVPEFKWQTVLKAVWNRICSWMLKILVCIRFWSIIRRWHSDCIFGILHILFCNLVHRKALCIKDNYILYKNN